MQISAMETKMMIVPEKCYWGLRVHKMLLFVIEGRCSGADIRLRSKKRRTEPVVTEGVTMMRKAAAAAAEAEAAAAAAAAAAAPAAAPPHPRHISYQDLLV